MMCKNVNMVEINKGATLDVDHFKNNADFKEEVKEAAKEAKKVDQDVFTHNDELAGRCFDKAIKTGLGFEPWVYRLYFDIRSALSDKTKKQTLTGRAQGRPPGTDLHH